MFTEITAEVIAALAIAALGFAVGYVRRRRPHVTVQIWFDTALDIAAVLGIPGLYLSATRDPLYEDSRRAAKRLRRLRRYDSDGSRELRAIEKPMFRFGPGEFPGHTFVRMTVLLVNAKRQFCSLDELGLVRVQVNHPSFRVWRRSPQLTVVGGRPFRPTFESQERNEYFFTNSEPLVCEIAPAPIAPRSKQRFSCLMLVDRDPGFRSASTGIEVLGSVPVRFKGYRPATSRLWQLLHLPMCVRRRIGARAVYPSGAAPTPQQPPF